MNLSEDQKMRYAELLLSGSKIDAIKACREENNVSLADAKQAIDGIEATMRAEGRLAEKSGCLGLLLMAAGTLLSTITS